MIAFLRGQVAHCGDGYVDLDVHDVGYRLFVTEQALTQLAVGQDVQLFTHHHVREDAILLYGFLSQADKAVFEKLLNVSGIGPRLAIQMIGSTSAESLVAAIHAEDANTLCLLPGVGKKTAQRIILDLKDKLSDLPMTWERTVNQGRQAALSRDVASDVIEALIGLGYRPKEAEAAVTAVLKKDAKVSVEAAVKAALSWLYAHSSEVNV